MAIQKIIRRRGVAVAVLVNEHGGVETRSFPASMNDDAIVAAVAPKSGTKPEAAKKTPAKKTPAKNAAPKNAAPKETGKNA